MNYDSEFGEMNYAKMAAKEPDIEGEGDHLLRSSFLLVPSQAPPGIPFFQILYFIRGLFKDTSAFTFPPSTPPPPFYHSLLYVLPRLFPPHGPLPCGIMGTYGPASTYRALNNCCSVPARCTNPPPPPVLNTPGLTWSPRTGRCVPH